jgi:Domain of unknown function (DUF4304)
LRSALRDIVGPAVREAAFKGSGRTWRRCSPAGDWGVVNVQQSMFSTAAEVRCVINVAVAPRPWLDWLHASSGPLRKSVSESLGLYRDRLHPSGSLPRRDTWWEVHCADAQEVAHDMVVQLEADGLPRLLNLSHRENLLAAIRERDLGHFRDPNLEVFFKRAEAVLIADRGLSPELEELLDYVTIHSTASQMHSARKFANWALAYASRVTT